MKHEKTKHETDMLLLRCLSEEASDIEYEQAWHWVHQSPDHKIYYAKLRDAWIASGLLQPTSRHRISAVWSRIEQQVQKSETPVKSQHIQFIKWVTAAAMIFFAYLLGTHTSKEKTDVHITDTGYMIEAPIGGKSFMTLGDGSRVWLNAGSTLYFDKTFNQQSRNLTLHGEAYFEVAQSKIPFSVEASGITIAALGTAFNIKAYPEDNIIETTLVEGSVRIETNAQSKTQSAPVLLEANQKATFHKHKATVPPIQEINVPPVAYQISVQHFDKIEVSEDVNTEIATSWKDKRWIVQGEYIGIFATNIERRYDVKLVFKDEELKNYKISATLEEETIEQLLNAIRHTVPMDYKIERNCVYISINKQLKTKYEGLVN